MENQSILTPEASNFSKKKIAEIAENLAEQLEYDCGGDIETVVKKLGGKIIYQDFWELETSDSGSIVINDLNDFEITLAQHTTRERDRFTIAHELGHYFLHYFFPRIKDASATFPKKMHAARYGFGRTETEAHWFAASFLMPEEKFREEFEKSDGSYMEVAEKFGVSLSACKVRAESLKLI